MHIKNITLKNFRNYKSQKVIFCKNYNILHGDNAQGKTNILEAIFICSSGRSHRTSKDDELINFSENFYNIDIDVENKYSEKNIMVAYKRDYKKTIKINDIYIKKMGDLMGNLICVIFSPEDLNMIKHGPSERRRFIDITISQLKPSYFYDLQVYSKIMTQRNALLREIRDKKSSHETLEVWNDRLIETGSKIIKVRHEFIERIKKYIKEIHYKLTDNKEELIYEYSPSFLMENIDIDNIRQSFKVFLNKNSYNDLKFGTTTIGPHRDEVRFIINEKNVKNYGSQGQQRTAVLSVKLSIIQLIKEQLGLNPVLLLDDVMSELDKKRQEYLLKSIEGLQSIITCTDREEIAINTEDEKKVKYFHVVGGEIKN